MWTWNLTCPKLWFPKGIWYLRYWYSSQIPGGINVYIYIYIYVSFWTSACFSMSNPSFAGKNAFGTSKIRCLPSRPSTSPWFTSKKLQLFPPPLCSFIKGWFFYGAQRPNPKFHHFHHLICGCVSPNFSPKIHLFPFKITNMFWYLKWMYWTL